MRLFFMAKTDETEETEETGEEKAKETPKVKLAADSAATAATKVIQTKAGPVKFATSKSKDLETKVSELEKMLQDEKEKTGKFENALKQLNANPKHKDVLDEMFSLLGWTE